MEVIEAIRTRRSVGQLKDTVPDQEIIGQMLESARWAPNHYKTEPWRFTVLTGEGRSKKLGEAYAKITLEKHESPTEEESRSAYERGVKKAKRAPVVIVVSVEPDSKDKVEWVEELAATSCAVQNMMLAAHSLGLGTKWRTGKPVYHPFMKEAFDVSSEGVVAGLLYVGYPEIVPNAPEKKAVHEFTTWIGE